MRYKFAKMGRIEAMQAIKCGFELETQSYDGDSGEGEPELDQDAYEDACVAAGSALLNEIMNANLRVTYINGRIDWRTPGDVPSRFDRIFGAGILAGIETLWLAAEDWGFLIYLSDLDICEDIEDWLRDEIEVNVDPEEYYFNSRNSFDIPSGLEAVEDGSVSGPEIIVKGNGTTAGRFSKLLRRLCEHDLEVDINCSFHIHISIPGIKHSYGAKFQALLYEYLWENWARTPAVVKERWARNKRGFFEPNIKNDKYTFVNFSTAHGTWEFRCFGNINTHKDGMACLQLAVEAMQFAYRVQLGMEKSKYNEVALRYKFRLLCIQNLDELSTSAAHINVAKALKEATKEARGRRDYPIFTATDLLQTDN